MRSDYHIIGGMTTLMKNHLSLITPKLAKQEQEQEHAHASAMQKAN